MKRRKDETVGPWAKEKLQALAEYLSFYTTVLKKQRHWLQGTIFVDAFAGSGRSRLRTAKKASTSSSLFSSDSEPDQDEIEYLKGSPRVALDLETPFSTYVFIERDPKRIAELTALKAEYGDTRNIVVLGDDANAAIQSWLENGTDWRYHRAVVFLDPFGMQVPWSTIEKLAKTKVVEVIINFPLGMAIQRLLTRSGKIPTGWQISLDVFFGSPDWRQLVYETSEDLFGTTRNNKVRDSGTRLLEWYRQRLRTIFGHGSTPRLIRNTRGNPSTT
jgi:three-Cys-motif partner protein